MARTPLPDHADPDDPWWERWALVGDAKDDLRVAVDALNEAREAFSACRVEALESGRRRGELVQGCGCGGHLEVTDMRAADVRAATVAVEAAIAAFKES